MTLSSHPVPERFLNRVDAGRHLAGLLSDYAHRSDVLVLGLPRGGVPVAAEVAARLGAPLDVFLVRKLGVPGHPELAMGAIAEGAVKVLDTRLITTLGIPAQLVEAVAVRERLELERRDRQYRGDRSRPVLKGRTVILIDDGLATGSTMQAAAIAVRQGGPATLILAAPVGAPATCERLRQYADAVICVLTPAEFIAVGAWYDDFRQTTDDEVRQLVGGSLTTTADDPVDVIRRRAIKLAGTPADHDAFLHAVGDARLVLIGEATHGTHEFYRERAIITQRLIRDKQFAAVAVEADWPDAHRVDTFVRGAGGADLEAADALAGFRRFPTWMWRNADVLDFVGWLRAHNDERPASERVGFYGLDLYSLHASMRAVIAFLDKVDPAAAQRARRRYGCFDRFGDQMQTYAEMTGLGLAHSCERDVVAQLIELQQRSIDYARRDGRLAFDDLFVAEQNARVVRESEAYYRTMLGSRVESWNLRDRHMTDTLAELMGFLEKTHRPPRIVVWAHNSHLGDARATQMGEFGELNVGQLARQRFEGGVISLGFTTYEGTVTAASDWDEPAQRKHVRPGLHGSYERLFHDCGYPRCLLPLRTDLALASVLSGPRLERAIGVIYRPETERHSHYFHARLPEQFDYVIHIDRTRAVEPLERSVGWDAGELAETYPSGL